MAARPPLAGLPGAPVPRVYRSLGRVHEFARQAPSSPVADSPWFLMVVTLVLVATVLVTGFARSSIANAGRAVHVAKHSGELKPEAEPIAVEQKKKNANGDATRRRRKLATMYA